MLNDEQFNQAKFSNISSKVEELDKILERSLPPNAAGLEARKHLIETLMWAERSLLK